MMNVANAARINVGDIVFCGEKKGIVIEKTGKSVAVCWVGAVQFIADNLPTFILTLQPRNIRRRFGQTAKDAIRTHEQAIAMSESDNDWKRVKNDSGVIGRALLASMTMLLVVYAFIQSIMIPF